MYHAQRFSTHKILIHSIAVLWTDALQAAVMMVALFSLAICGVIEVGGFGTAWQRSAETERTKFFE